MVFTSRSSIGRFIEVMTPHDHGARILRISLANVIAKGHNPNKDYDGTPGGFPAQHGGDVTPLIGAGAAAT